MVFRIVSLISLAAAALGLSFVRYKASRTSQPFFVWITNAVRQWLKKRRLSGPRDWFHEHLIQPNPRRRRWIFVGLLVSFLYLASSGFVYALFCSRPLTGIFLMAHVGLGGLFALCLVPVVMIRAGIYALSSPGNEGADSQDPAPPLVSRLLFWVFAGSGLLLILTALLMMLPLFAQPGHALTVELHRYSALAAVLSALAFATLNLTPPGGGD
jgi:hypothetical protein